MDWVHLEEEQMNTMLISTSIDVIWSSTCSGETILWCLCGSVSVYVKMANLFLPTSKTFWPTFQTFCPVGVHFAQTVAHFAHFQVQARKRGVLGWDWGYFVFASVHVPKRVCDGWVKNRGWWWYSGHNQTPSGQNETHMGDLYEKWAKVL